MMALSRKRITVPGSEKKAVPAAKVIGEVDPNERIEITVVLRPRTSNGSPSPEAAMAEALQAGAQLPQQRKYLSREELATQRGADPEEVAKVEDFAKEHNLTVVDSSLAKRSIRLSGTVEDLTAAFRPKLKQT